ncbi:MAG TPA: alpha/beta hydrolase [Gaiellaceae bacterium]
MRVVLESGRRVAVHRTTTHAAWFPASRGAEERVVVLCHAAPGAGIFDPDPAETRARNVRLLSVDRPGYGGSDPIAAGAWATVGSAADDLAAVLDSLHVAQVGVAGWSAGGRVALALAARRPDLVDRVVVVGTPAPDAEVPWIAREQRDELERLRALAPEVAHAELGERLRSVVPEDPHSPEALWLLGAGSADEAALRADGVRLRLGEMLEAAFVQDVRGLAADIAGYCLQPWGFEPGAVRAKTLLLYGSRDALADPRHGRWWQSRLPDARLEVAPGAGHLLLIPRWATALSHLVPDRTQLHLAEGPLVGPDQKRVPGSARRPLPSWASAHEGPRSETDTDDVEEFSAA